MKLKLSTAILFLIFAGLIITYFLLIPIQAKHNRYTLYLVNARTGKIGTEARYVLKTNIKSREQQFVEELIFGAMDHNFYDYFAKDTKYEVCYVDDETLYVAFPSTILSDINSKMTFEKFYQLFEKNIFANFSHIKEVCMFLDGTQVYGSEITE